MGYDLEAIDETSNRYFPQWRRFLKTFPSFWSRLDWLEVLRNCKSLQPSKVRGSCCWEPLDDGRASQFQRIQLSIAPLSCLLQWAVRSSSYITAPLSGSSVSGGRTSKSLREIFGTRLFWIESKSLSDSFDLFFSKCVFSVNVGYSRTQSSLFLWKLDGNGNCMS